MNARSSTSNGINLKGSIQFLAAGEFSWFSFDSWS
jgi:hypothetical protein